MCWSLSSEFADLSLSLVPQAFPSRSPILVASSGADSHSHLHENFLYPVSINSNGRYNVPLEENCGYSIEMYQESIDKFTFPTGSYWVAAAAGNAPKPDHLGLKH
jgi:hypothetical protein